MEINLPFDSSAQTMELIKLAALYYDRVNVLCPKFTNVKFQLNEQTLPYSMDRIKILRQNGIVEKKMIDVGMTSEEVLHQVIELIKSEELEIITEQNIESFVCSHLVMESDDSLERGLDVFFALAAFCSVQVIMLYNTICNNQNYTSSNQHYSQWMSKLLQSNGEKSEHFVKTQHNLMTVFGTTPILLPNFSRLSYEDILEMRLKASDELQELRCYLSELSSKYDPEDKHLVTAKDFIERDINRAVKQFESKVYGLRVGMIQRALKAIPAVSTVPMVTTFCTNIPTWISIGLSAGILVADGLWEYTKQRQDLATDPLYFTVKLRKYGKGKR